MIEAWARLNVDYDIFVFYTDSDDQGRGWITRPIAGVKEQRLPILIQLGKYGMLNRDLVGVVKNHDIVMIGGFEQASYFASALLARLYQKPVILLFDGFSPARFNNEWFVVTLVKRLTASLCDVFFANGEVSRRYLIEHLYVDKRKPVYNQYLSHSDFFIASARKKVANLDKRALQKSLGIVTDRKILLSSGYLIKRKRIDLVIDAIALLPDHDRPLLLVVGKGPLESELMMQAATLNVKVIFVGFKQQVELATLYFAADALVLSSEDDPWGLVVNEAMSAGLPVIVSDACGAALDLVKDGENGYVFPNLNSTALAHSIRKILSSNLFEMGNASRRLIEQWTAEHSGANLARCISAAISNRYAKNTLTLPKTESHTKRVIVIHERDGTKYMEAIRQLSDNRAIGPVRFAEASVFRKFAADVIRNRREFTPSFVRAFKNAVFRISLSRITNTTIIFGIAPWDYRFLIYRSLATNNRLIYHTSWPNWHSDNVPRSYGFLTPLLRKAWLNTLRKDNVEVVAVSREAALSVWKLLPGKPVHVIPHVISDVFFKVNARYEKPFRILFVGELSKKKGIYKLPAIMEALASYNCLLEMAGDGPARGFVKKWANSNGKISWHGHISNRGDLAALMGKCQVLVVPSIKAKGWEELFGMVIIEAMATGLPVVASRHIGPQAVVQHDESGYLVDQENIAGFANAIEKLIGSREQWLRLSNASRATAKQYALPVISERWQNFLLRRGGLTEGSF